MDDQQSYQRALAQVRALRDLYIHAMVYALVIGGLLGLDWLTGSPGLTWSYYPAVGWGVGLAIHAFMVLGAGRLLGADWERRKVTELLERQRRAEPTVYAGPDTPPARRAEPEAEAETGARR